MAQKDNFIKKKIKRAIRRKVLLWIGGILTSTVGIYILMGSTIAVLMIVLLSVLGEQAGHNIETEHIGSYEMVQIPEALLKYEDDIKEALEKHELSESFLPILMAIAAQESGGSVPDIFQSSESLGLPPNSIGPKESIDQGVKYFKQLVDMAEVENAQDENLNIALQSYNFGEGFISYAQDKGGYSESVAQSFSKMMAGQMGWSSYGDPSYVQNVSKYIGGVATGDIEGMIVGDMALPVSQNDFTNNMICGLGCYYDAGSGTPHPGYDFGIPRGTPVYSMVDGTVIESRSGYPDNPRGIPLGVALSMDLGNYIRIVPDNNKNVVISYFHLTGAGNGVMVKKGMKVEKGQVIGHSGNSGRTTGDHLHLDMLVGGRYHIDSAVPYYDQLMKELN